MINALLAKTQTVTHRPINIPLHGRTGGDDWVRSIYEDGGGNWVAWSCDTPDLPAFTKKAYPNGAGFPCPFGRPGDHIWLAEAIHMIGNGEWRYLADNKSVCCNDEKRLDAMWTWVLHMDDDYCSASHMPRWASRLAVKIKSVRIGRIQQISELDCENETGQLPYSLGNRAYAEYQALWDQRHRPPHKWQANPWTWRIEFALI
jgi:hypothetical protein